MRILYCAFVDASYSQILEKIDGQYKAFLKHNMDTHCYVLGKSLPGFYHAAHSFDFVNSDYTAGPLERMWKFRIVQHIADRIKPDILYFRYPLFDKHAYHFFRKNPLVVTEHQTCEYPELLIGGNVKAARDEAYYGQRCLKKLRAVVGVNPAVVSYQLKRSGVNMNSHVMSNGIDMSKNPISRRLFDTNHIDILCAASFRAWHGIDRLIKGVQKYKGNRRFTIHLAGDGPEKQKCLAMIDALGLNNRFAIHNWLEKADMQNLANRCQVAVGSLGIHRLNGLKGASPLKYREYAARGIPFVFSGHDVDFPPSLPFVHIIPSDESPLTVETLLNLADENVDSHNFSVRFRQYAETNLTWNVKIKGLVDFLSNLTPFSTNNVKSVLSFRSNSKEHFKKAIPNILSHYWTNNLSVPESLGLAIQLQKSNHVDEALFLFSKLRNRSFSPTIDICVLIAGGQAELASGSKLQADILFEQAVKIRNQKKLNYKHIKSLSLSLYYVASSLEKHNRHEAALFIFELISKSRSSRIIRGGSFYHQGVINLKIGKTDTAYRMLTEAIRLIPEHQKARQLQQSLLRHYIVK